MTPCTRQSRRLSMAGYWQSAVVGATQTNGYSTHALLANPLPSVAEGSSTSKSTSARPSPAFGPQIDVRAARRLPLPSVLRCTVFFLKTRGRGAS